MAQSTSSTGNQPLIELKHVDKHYGDLHVLNDINLSVDRGEVVVVIGPSGSGKSTMCRTINRLETIDSGEILIEGEPLPQEGKDLARMRAELGMVFQQFNLFAHMTVLQNVMLGPCWASPRTRPASAPWTCWAAWALPNRPIRCPHSSRAASSSA